MGKHRRNEEGGPRCDGGREGPVECTVVDSAATDSRSGSCASLNSAHSTPAQQAPVLVRVGRHVTSPRHRMIDRLLSRSHNTRWVVDAIVNIMANEELSVLQRAQELVKSHDEEDRAKRIEREGRVRQVAALITTYSNDCARQLAGLLDIPENDPVVSGMKWRLSASGDKLISFNPADNDLMVDMHRMPMLVTNVEGYTVGAKHLLGTDVYEFGLTCGDENWSGFDDLESFGRSTLQSTGGRYKWGETKFSQYQE